MGNNPNTAGIHDAGIAKTRWDTHRADGRANGIPALGAPRGGHVAGPKRGGHLTRDSFPHAAAHAAAGVDDEPSATTSESPKTATGRPEPVLGPVGATAAADKRGAGQPAYAHRPARRDGRRGAQLQPPRARKPAHGHEPAARGQSDFWRRAHATVAHAAFFAVFGHVRVVG